MKSLLTNEDYANILRFYNMNVPKSKSEIRKQAQHVMASKLCRCIKKIDNVEEARSIGICTKTIFGTKGFTRGKFNCTKNMSVYFTKKSASKSTKTKKRTTMSSKKTRKRTT